MIGKTYQLQPLPLNSCGTGVAIIHIAFGALVVGKLVKNNTQFRPFHSDGCSGLAPVGELIILLWVFAIAVAAEILVTLKLGYLNIEYTPATWILAFIGLCALPLIGFFPLFCCARTLRKGKLTELNGFEPALTNFYTAAKLAAQVGRDDVAADFADKAGKLRDLCQHLSELSIWPFDRRAFGVIFVIYAIQFSIAMHELLSGK